MSFVPINTFQQEPQRTFQPLISYGRLGKMPRVCIARCLQFLAPSCQTLDSVGSVSKGFKELSYEVVTQLFRSKTSFTYQEATDALRLCFIKNTRTNWRQYDLVNAHFFQHLHPIAMELGDAPDLFSLFKNMRSLTLRGYRSADHAPFDDTAQRLGSVWKKITSQLTHLELEGVKKEDREPNWPILFLQAFAPHTPQLRSLTLNVALLQKVSQGIGFPCREIDLAPECCRQLDKLPQLDRLELRVSQFSSLTFVAVLQNCPQLATLEVNSQPDAAWSFKPFNERLAKLGGLVHGLATLNLCSERFCASSKGLFLGQALGIEDDRSWREKVEKEHRKNIRLFAERLPRLRVLTMKNEECNNLIQEECGELFAQRKADALKQQGES